MVDVSVRSMIRLIAERLTDDQSYTDLLLTEGVGKKVSGGDVAQKRHPRRGRTDVRAACAPVAGEAPVVADVVDQ